MSHTKNYNTAASVWAFGMSNLRADERLVLIVDAYSAAPAAVVPKPAAPLVIDTPPPADKVGKLSLEENARAAAKAYSDALALYFCGAQAYDNALARYFFYATFGGAIDTPPANNKLALSSNVRTAKKAYYDALALDPNLQAEPALIGLDVPALPEVISAAPAAVVPKAAAPLHRPPLALAP